MARPSRVTPERVFQLIGARIREIRQAGGKTQEALAVAASMQPETISRIETAAVFADVATLHRVAVALGVELVDIVGPAHTVPRPVLPTREVDLLAAYRALDDEGRDVIDRLLPKMKSKAKKKSPARS